MAKSLIDSELISDPRLYRLALRHDDDSLHALIYRPGEPEATIYHRLPLDMPGLTVERCLEEAVYDNPLLLADFDRVTVNVDTPRYALVPDDAFRGDPLLAEAIADRLLPSAPDDPLMTTLTSPLAPGGVTVVMKMPEKTEAFLRRTFNNPSIRPVIAPLADYFYDSSRIGHGGKVYVNLRRGALDIVAFATGCLRLANSFRFREAADAVYYILAVDNMLKQRGDGDEREFLMTGDAALRDEITGSLREYAGYVMPAVYPPSLTRSPKEALKAPFDLTILQLCE